MAKKKKISRKELLKAPDEFLTVTSKIFKYVEEHKTAVVSVAVVFFLVLTGIAGFRYVSQKSDSKAFAMLQNAVNRYRKVLSESSPEKALDRVAGDFRQIIENYPGQNGGKLAGVFYANIQYRAGKFTEAAELYADVLERFDKASPIRDLIISGLGHCSLCRNDTDDAFHFFNMTASASDNIFMKDEALFLLGCLHARNGERDQSQAAFKRIVSDFHESFYVKPVKNHISG